MSTCSTRLSRLSESIVRPSCGPSQWRTGKLKGTLRGALVLIELLARSDYFVHAACAVAEVIVLDVASEIRRRLSSTSTLDSTSGRSTSNTWATGLSRYRGGPTTRRSSRTRRVPSVACASASAAATRRTSTRQSVVFVAETRSAGPGNKRSCKGCGGQSNTSRRPRTSTPCCSRTTRGPSKL